MDIEKASKIIKDDTKKISDRMRSLFYLRNIETDASAYAIEQSFTSKSVLLKHEAAYVLGQMRRDCSIPKLIEVLLNKGEDEIVRHEAGEALGNYYSRDDIVYALETCLNDDSSPVRETCDLALKNINYGNIDTRNFNDKINDERNIGNDYLSPYNSRDPARPLFFDYNVKNDLNKAFGDRDFKDEETHNFKCFENTPRSNLEIQKNDIEKQNFEKASNIFLHSTDLYEKYQAMFYLRNLNSEEAVKILGQGFNHTSSLFKHEISFVFGQMRNPLSVPFLIKTMEKEDEHGMVRHECAEALGIIGTKECLDELVKFRFSECDILRESVEVAMDLHGYINSKESEYCVV